MDTENNSRENLDFAYQVASRKLDLQVGVHAQLESKAGLFLGFVTTLLGSTILLLKDSHGLIGSNLFSFGLALQLATAGLLTYALKNRQHFDPPTVKVAYGEDAFSKSHIDYKNQIVSDMFSSYEKNNKNQALKADAVNRALLCFGISIFCFVIHFVIENYVGRI